MKPPFPNAQHENSRSVVRKIETPGSSAALVGGRGRDSSFDEYRRAANDHWSIGAPTPPTASKAVLLDMPFDFSSGVILLDADLGGSHPRKLIFDTGNNVSVLDSVTAKELGLSPTPEPTPAAAASRPFKRLVPTVALGGQSFGSLEMYVAPLSQQVADDYGVHCEGTLGYGFFKDRIVQIDYPKRRFRIIAHAPMVATPGDATMISWRKYWSKSPDLVTVENLAVAGHPVCAQIDTFLAHSAILFFTKLPWLKSEPAPEVAAINYEEAKLGAGRVPGGLSLGEVHTDDATPVYLAGADAHVPETEIAAILGNEFFRQSVLTFDFPGSRLLVESAPK